MTTDSSFYFYEGSNWAKVGRAGWSLSGNTGTNPAAHFLGTSDNMPLIFRVNNTSAFRLEYAAKDNAGANAPAPNVIGGYSGNTVAAGIVGSTISGGGIELDSNSITADFSTIGGGSTNTVSKEFGTVSGGNVNYAGGNSATVSGGESNSADGAYSAVTGGSYNIADGDFSLASGRRAIVDAAHGGAFFFSDQNNFDFNSATANEFAAGPPAACAS